MEERETNNSLNNMTSDNRNTTVKILIISAVVILSSFLIVNIANGGSPSNVVKSFLTSASRGDFQKAGTYLAPNIPWDTSVDIGGARVKIKIIDMEEFVQDDYAVVYVQYDEQPQTSLFSGPYEMVVKLKKIDGKWLIYDMQ